MKALRGPKSQRELAECAELSTSVLVCIERGRSARTASVVALLEALGTDIESLLARGRRELQREAQALAEEAAVARGQ